MKHSLIETALKKLVYIIIFLVTGFTATAQQKRNIICILADEMGYGDLSALNAKAKSDIGETKTLENKYPGIIKTLTDEINMDINDGRSTPGHPGKMT